jgi:protein-arginine kinase activator protein McsA
MQQCSMPALLDDLHEHVRVSAPIAMCASKDFPTVCETCTNAAYLKLQPHLFDQELLQLLPVLLTAIPQLQQQQQHHAAAADECAVCSVTYHEAWD